MDVGTFDIFALSLSPEDSGDNLVNSRNAQTSQVIIVYVRKHGLKGSFLEQAYV